MIFEGLSGRTKVIYDGLWGDTFEFHEDVEPIASVSKKGYNVSSYKYKCENGKEEEIIKEAYSLTEKELFSQKYALAVSGNGDEAKKITTIHSSSRCSLLCFYLASEKKPIKLNIDGREVEFTYSTFEFKNPVMGYPSNMDVVLLNEKERIVLFLESKFSEYYMSASKKSSPISVSYKENDFSKWFYEEKQLHRMGLTSEGCTYKDSKGNEQEGFCLNATESVYLNGIKQMISHYVGVRNRLVPSSENAFDIERDMINGDAKRILDVVKNGTVYLGEVIFDFRGFKTKGRILNPSVACERYQKMYEELAKLMNERIQEDSKKDDRICCFKVLEKDLLYSDVMAANQTTIDKRVLEFYGIERE